MEMASATAEERVALVAGVTGIVGLSLAKLLLSQGEERPSWRLYGVARRPKPAWFPSHPSASYMACDLLDREQTLATLSPLSTRVTHLFFTTWTNRGSEHANVDANASMLRNALDALLHPHSALLHVCLQTGSKHYLGPFDSMISRALQLDHNLNIVFHEDFPRLPGPNFYYAQEDLLLEAAARSSSMPARAAALTWSVHRPPLILGVSPAALLQLPLFLAVYACICKHDEEGLPFVFTGNAQRWEATLEAADSQLIAEQEIWAATHSEAHNKAFNVANGDEIRWREVWPAVAAFFKLEAPPYRGDQSQSMAQILQSKAHVWERVVSQYKLHGTEWEHLMIGWRTLDLCICKLPPYRLSTAKSAQLGFVTSPSDTLASLLANFQTLQTMKLIPPCE